MRTWREGSRRAGNPLSPERPESSTQFVSGVELPSNIVWTEVSDMVTQRLEVRLDRERRRKLSELAQGRGVPVSQAVRQMIDEAYKEALRERRIRAARELARLAVEDVPDPATLSRQLEGTYEPADLS